MITAIVVNGTSKPGIGAPVFTGRLSAAEQERLGVVRIPEPLDRQEAARVLDAAAETKRGKTHRAEVFEKMGRVHVHQFDKPKLNDSLPYRCYCSFLAARPLRRRRRVPAASRCL